MAFTFTQEGNSTLYVNVFILFPVTFLFNLQTHSENFNHLFRKRVTSEEWLIRELGAYLPGVYEQVSSELSYLQIDFLYVQ